MTETNEAVIQKKKYYIGGTTVETDKPFRERSKADFYPTEQALIDAYIQKERWQILDYAAKSEVVVADLGAGDGRWGLSLKKKYPDVYILGLDIRDLPDPGFDYWYPNRNFLETINPKTWDVILGNPPYNIAMEWLNKCLEKINKRYGEIHLLLPLSFLSGEKRYNEFYSNKIVPDVTICSTRPSFSEDGKTYPSREYGMFKWEFRGGFCITSGQLSWLSYERNKK